MNSSIVAALATVGHALKAGRDWLEGVLMIRVGLVLELLLLAAFVFLWVDHGWSGFAFSAGALTMSIVHDSIDKGWWR